MKVTVQKLGVIQKADIDLKPLTIFIGPNNTGKTWLAYILAGIFGTRGRDEYARAYAAGELSAAYAPLDNAIEKVLAEGMECFPYGTISPYNSVYTLYEDQKTSH